MADHNSALGPLPNGWEQRHDPRTRRNYFINYNNKTTTWDDPRANPPIMNNAPPPYHDPADIMGMQPQLHGTPDHRNVYPSNLPQYHPQPAFHMPSPYIQELLRQDMTSYRPSPVPGRAITAPLMGSHAIGHHNSSKKIHETSFSNAIATEQSVAKISAMFPTVSETHIRALLIKYHSREAVVISALQVEKNPLTTPGPFSTPPLARHIIIPPPVLPPNYHATPVSGLRDFISTPPPSLYSYGYGTGGTLTGSHASSSCMGSPAIRHSPRPHSSPKMKLRYMKSMFPKADETVILDTLYNVDNNVQAATTQLQAMGFDKKDSATPSCAGTPSAKIKDLGKTAKNEKENIISTPTSSARLKSVVEKQEMRDRLKKNHPDLAEQLILMALDSVDYDESRAGQILDMMIKEESTPKSTHPNSASSSQRPQSSKSDAEVSSVGTKTTVEADVAVHSTQKSDETKLLVKENVKGTQQSTSNVEDASINDPKLSTAGKSGTASQTISTNATVHSPPNLSSSTIPTSPLPPTKTSLKKTKAKKDVPKVSRGTSTTEDKEYRSVYRFTPSGPNSSLHHGPNHELLIEDYVAWTGPLHHSEGRSSLAKGANQTLLSTHRYSAKGQNQGVCKGPQKGLAKGSMYSHLAACNGASALVVLESRGK